VSSIASIANDICHFYASDSVNPPSCPSFLYLSAIYCENLPSCPFCHLYPFSTYYGGNYAKRLSFPFLSSTGYAIAPCLFPLVEMGCENCFVVDVVPSSLFLLENGIGSRIPSFLFCPFQSGSENGPSCPFLLENGSANGLFSSLCPCNRHLCVKGNVSGPFLYTTSTDAF